MSNNNEKSREFGGIKLTLQRRFYTSHTIPHGVLDASWETQALWHYYVTVYHAFNDIVNSPVVMEGTSDPYLKCFNLFKGIARMFDVDPEKMESHWLIIDAEARRCGFPELGEDLKRPNRGQSFTTQR